MSEEQPVESTGKEWPRHSKTGEVITHHPKTGKLLPPRVPLPGPEESMGPDLLNGRDPEELSDKELMRVWDLYIADPDLHPMMRSWMIHFRDENWLPKLLRERETAERRIDAYRHVLRRIPKKQKDLEAGEVSEITNGRKEAQRATVEGLPEALQAEMRAVQERSGELFDTAQVVETLGHDVLDIQVRIAATHELATRLENLAKNLGMYAIDKGALSQAQVSRLLDVAPMTVNRWVKATKENQEQGS